jgi:NAD(P)-dependent dehydrogenase (short-subunit alcohol dehydrogenase family)
MQGKRILITGATNGIGLAAARMLAAQGARVAIVGRSATRTEHAARSIAAAGNSNAVDTFLADLASQASVRRLAAEVLERYARLDVLINNAGAMFAARQRTAEGIELTWALNHLAPFLLTTLLLERLKASAPARIITTASDAHQGYHIPFDDLGADRSYGAFRRYGESKLANILFTRELARRLEGSGVTANCLHPGLVATGFNHNTGLIRSLAMTVLGVLSRSPEQGAATLVWLAGSPEPAGVSGGYFVDLRQKAPSAPAQGETGRRLWQISEKQCGISRT